MHTPDLAAIHRRIRRAFTGAPGDFLSFEEKRQITWGYETRRGGSDYSWDGLQRGVSPKQARVLFQYTLEGFGEYAEGAKLFGVNQGYGFTVVLPSPHRYFLPDHSRQWTFFWLMIRHPFFTERIRELREREAAVQAWAPGTPALESAVMLFEALCGGQVRDIWSFEEKLFAWLLESERELHQRRYPEIQRRELLEQTRRVVLSRLDRPPSATELADVHQLERTTFSRKFKARTGLSPAAFVTEVRLEEALKLLRTNAKLEEIAERTGFADANHFCKVFRKHFHASPGAYRRLILKI